MANTLFITEVGRLTQWGANDSPVPVMPPVAEQALTVAGNTVSAALNANTQFVILHAEVALSLAFGPTNAVVANPLVHQFSAGETRTYAVNPGSFIAAILPTD